MSPIVMGILNATPDSFYDGGKYEDLILRAEQLTEAGADWIDIGGESTRPGAKYVSLEEELHRVIPVIKAVSKFATVSIDTTKAAVAKAAYQAGASILNDVKGLQDPEMQDVSALFNKTIIMHSRGTPSTMQNQTQYGSLIDDIQLWLLEQAKHCKSNEIWLDPGIGFAKTAEQSMYILKSIDRFVELGYPILIGASRKSFIGHKLNKPTSQDRLAGSLAAVAAGFYGGAQAFRVHDVQETKDVLDFLNELSLLG